MQEGDFFLWPQPSQADGDNSDVSAVCECTRVQPARIIGALLSTLKARRPTALRQAASG